MNADKIENTVLEFSSNPHKGSIIIFECEGAVAGYAILAFQWSNEFGSNIMVIDELYICRELRNNGIATKFLRSLHLFYEGISAIRIDMDGGNEKARRYYNGLGFKIFKTTLSKVLADEEEENTEDGAKKEMNLWLE